MLKLLLLALPFIPVALAHAPSPEPAIKADEPVRCEIRQSRMTGGVQLEGVVLSTKALSGTYEFNVDKRGSGGTSSSMQSGAFEAAAGEEALVGQVGLGLERGASYAAELRIRWRGGEAECVKRHPDRV